MKINSKKIRNLMNINFITQTALAESAGVSRATINSALLKSSCSIKTVNSIADALAVEPAELIEEEL